MSILKRLLGYKLVKSIQVKIIFEDTKRTEHCSYYLYESWLGRSYETAGFSYNSSTKDHRMYQVIVKPWLDGAITTETLRKLDI